jgi:hypothetical protein
MVLEISWSTGEALAVDVSEQVRRFKVLAPLSDPEFFSRAHVGLWGHSVAWTDDADLGADLLYELGRSQAGLPTPGEFDRWIVANGLSLTKAAETLGLSRRMVAHYRSGSKPIPRIVGLACKGWEAERKKAA